jgi:hypothetical protein
MVEFLALGFRSIRIVIIVNAFGKREKTPKTSFEWLFYVNISTRLKNLEENYFGSNATSIGELIEKFYPSVPIRKIIPIASPKASGAPCKIPGARISWLFPRMRP